MKPSARRVMQALSDADPVLGEVITRVGRYDLAPEAELDLFQALLRSIIYQQLHGKAAATIHGRVVAQLPEVTARAVQAVGDEPLRAAGLSANKLRAIRDLAEKSLAGTVPTAEAARLLSDEELVERLTEVRGIGPWTVHMLMIFSMGRLDVLPTGDFAVNKAFSLLYRKGRTVTPESMIRHARRWQPYRSVASWYLWRYLDTRTPQS